MKESGYLCMWEPEALNDISNLQKLFKQRFAVVRDVWILKKQKKIEPLDKDRWLEVLEAVWEKAAEIWLCVDLIRDLWDTMHEIAIEIEEVVSAKDASPEKADYEDAILPLRHKIDELDPEILSMILKISHNNRGDKTEILLSDMLSNF